MSFYFRDEVLPYYAGDAEAARDLAANDFKYWELMRRACERGVARVRLRPQQARHRLVRVQEELGLRAAAARLRVPLAAGATRCRRTIRSNPKYRALIATVAAAAAACRQRASGRCWCAISAELHGRISSTSCTGCPYPPNKGDKVRSYHILRAPRGAAPRVPRHVRRRSRRTWHTSPGCATLCAGVARRSSLQPRLARLRSAVAGSLRNEALSVAVLPQRARWRAGSTRRVRDAGHRRGDRVLVGDGAVRRWRRSRR